MRISIINPPRRVGERRQSLQCRSWLPALCVCGLLSATSVGQPVLYVDADATGPLHDGSSWCAAFLHLQDALAAAEASTGAVTEIRVANGTYRPDQGGGVLPGDRTASFRLINGVTIRGGYAGCGEPDPDDRDPRLHKSILSGDLNGDDDEGPGDGTPGVCCYDDSASGCDDPDCLAQLCRQLPDCCTHSWHESCRNLAHVLCCNCENPSSALCENSMHVVVGESVDPTSVLDGFTITAGNADGLHFGGGLNLYDASPTISNCVFAGNRTGPTEDNPVARCGDGGGGLFTTYGDPTLVNCVFRGNTSANQGGGMLIRIGSPTLTNCVFTGNTAASYGGGLMAASDFAEGAPLINCTFSQNSASSYGGVYCLAGVVLTNCILWGNTDDSGDSLSAQVNLFRVQSFDHTCIQGLPDNYRYWYEYLGGPGNTGDDPMFVDAGGPDGIPGTEDDDLRLSPGSPCINTGDPGFVPGPNETDLDGNPRLQGCRIDMGAWEADEPQALGDFDGDGDWDLEDFAAFQICLHADLVDHEWLEACLCVFDFDATDQIDLADYAEFLHDLAGP